MSYTSVILIVVALVGVVAEPFVLRQARARTAGEKLGLLDVLSTGGMVLIGGKDAPAFTRGPRSALIVVLDALTTGGLSLLTEPRRTNSGRRGQSGPVASA